jgi:hypothetical protein
MGRKRRRQQNDNGASELEDQRTHVEKLPDGVQHYDYVNEAPWDIQQ